jgi:hypothetical protein
MNLSEFMLIYVQLDMFIYVCCVFMRLVCPRPQWCSPATLRRPQQKTRAWISGACTLRVCMLLVDLLANCIILLSVSVSPIMVCVCVVAACGDFCDFFKIAKWIRMPSWDVWVIATAEPDPIQVAHCDGGEKTLRPVT